MPEFSQLEIIVSSPRLSRYQSASGGDRKKAVELYWLNIKLSQSLFAIIGLFELCLRNTIHQHYSKLFNDHEWIKNQCHGSGFLINPSMGGKSSISSKKVKATVRKLGVTYSSDRLVAEMSLGFWVHLFSPRHFFLAGQNLHRIFVNRPKGTRQKQIFNELTCILELRNRIAHHEPICFDKQNKIDLTKTEQAYDLIIQYTTWLNAKSAFIYREFDDVKKLINTINHLR